MDSESESNMSTTESAQSGAQSSAQTAFARNGTLL